MRGHSLFNTIFWGLILVIAGLLMIINYIFKLNIPVFKILLGLFLICLGVYLVIGFKGWRHESYNDGKTTVFSEMSITPETVEDEYNIIFSKGEIDLSNISNENLGKAIEISAIFGSASVRLPTNFPVKIKGSAVFGSVTLPNKQSLGFGEVKFQSSDSTEALYIEANAIFGNIVFVQ